MRERLQRFFDGRNGVDNLGQFLNITSLILLILGIFTLPVFSFLGIALYIWNLYRMLSRNLYKRSQENDAYLQLTNKVKKWLSLQKKRFAQRKTHRIYRCPSCKQAVRVPKGKGKISLTCPTCQTQFIKKS